MRISRAQIGQVIRVYKAQSALGTTPKGPAPDSAKSSDSIKLSFNQADLERVRDSVAQAPEVRSERVLELSKAIKEGKYKIDPEDVADKMLGRMLADKIR